MASVDYMLCIDIGSSSIKAAEFSYTPSGEMLMERFAFEEFSTPDSSLQNIVDSNARVDLLEALHKVLTTNNFYSKKVCLSLSGHDAYIRFVKVPAIVTDEKKIRQIIEFEAKSAIPYDMSEVVWDSQLLKSADDSGEIEAMLVIVKGDEIEEITSLIESAGKQVQFVEVSPTACYNAARLNGVGDTDCELILNIGDRCSSLLFVDSGRLFVRIIPIAGHAITLQISKEFGISYKEAEEMKRRHGFVALGGAYEEPDSEVAATVSKIVRNVMTRLHGEISRSINVYRSQQKGRKPEKLYLSGGCSVMGYTPRFFSEKLKMPVEYLNPFKNIALGPDVDKEKLADIAHMFSEPIGLALRNMTSCPVEISLMPHSLQKSIEFKAKTPFFYASAATLLLCLLVTFFSLSKQAVMANAKKEIAVEQLKKTESKVKLLRSAESDFSGVKSSYDEAVNLLNERIRWPELINEVQAILPNDVWITKFSLSRSTGAKVQRSEEGGLFGGMSEKPAQVAQDYVSVFIAGHGLVKNQSFAENFTKRLSNSKYFVFNPATDTIDKLQNGVLQKGEYNVATFELTLKMKNIIKQ